MIWYINNRKVKLKFSYERNMRLPDIAAVITGRCEHCDICESE